MAEAVDVLAVMDEWVRLFATPAGDVRMNHDLRAARDAVAALITEADGFLHFSDAHPLHYRNGPLASEFHNFQRGLRKALEIAAAPKLAGGSE